MNGLFGNIGGMIDNISDMAGQAAMTMKEIGNMGTQIEQLTKMVSIVRKGGNPMELITSFAQQNPQAQQMLSQLQGKSPDELRAYAENMAKSYGTDLNAVAKQLGIQMPQ